jgi:hypothetical protein
MLIFLTPNRLTDAVVFHEFLSSSVESQGREA